VAVGEIVGAHGLGGDLRVVPLTDRPERFEGMTECVVWDEARGTRETRGIRRVRRQGNLIILGLVGCHSPEAARLLVGRVVAVPASRALPLAPGQFYAWQLEGAKVVDEDGHEIGRVTRVDRGAGHDLWAVQGPEREHLIPAVPEIVLEVDIAAGRVVIRPPAGLLEL
jgi:16S rRNA processing protein RimM